MADNVDLSLAALADLEMDNVEEVRFEALPIGTYGFEIGEPECNDEEGPDGGNRVRIQIPMKIVEVKAVVSPKVDKEALIDRQHTERFFIKDSDPMRDLGRFKSFVVDIGGNWTGTFKDIVASLEGHTFYASTRQQKDKTDKSIVYTRLKLTPMKKAGTASAAAA